MPPHLIRLIERTGAGGHTIAGSWGADAGLVYLEWSASPGAWTSCTGIAGARVADIVEVGQEPDPEALRASGLEIAEQFTGAGEDLLRFNRPAIRAVGVPSGGAITNAGTLALFYQALLRDGRGSDGTQV